LEILEDSGDLNDPMILVGGDMNLALPLTEFGGDYPQGRCVGRFLLMFIK
jgi:hypothetical protein